MGRLGYGPSLQWAEFVMGEMSSYLGNHRGSDSKMWSETLPLSKMSHLGSSLRGKFSDHRMKRQTDV